MQFLETPDGTGLDLDGPVLGPVGGERLCLVAVLGTVAPIATQAPVSMGASEQSINGRWLAQACRGVVVVPPMLYAAGRY